MARFFVQLRVFHHSSPGAVEAAEAAEELVLLTVILELLSELLPEAEPEDCVRDELL